MGDPPSAIGQSESGYCLDEYKKVVIQESSTEADDSGCEYRRRRYQCGDFCSFNILKIPGLLLRNAILPRELWDEFPNGFERIADKFVFQPDSARGNVPTPDEFEIQCEFEDVTIVTKDKVKIHCYLIKSTKRDRNSSTLDENKNEIDMMTNSVSKSNETTSDGNKVDDDKNDADLSNNKTNFNKGSKLDENRNEIEEFPLPLSATVPTIIYFHGNAGNIGYCLDVVKTMKDDPDLAPCNWFLMEYRGYGKSEGKQTEKGLYNDGKAAIDYIESRHDLNPKKIILFGHSLGGAVAINLASHPRYRKKVAGLILENTFTSVPQLAKKILGMGFVKYLPKCFYSAKFESISKINKVKCPTMFAVGIYDEIVPYAMSETLYKKCGASEKIIQKFCGEHNDTYKSYGFPEKVAEFLMKNNVL